MCTLGMTCQVCEGRLQGGIQSDFVPAFQGLDNVA
jgi:hypothetical protein